MHYILPERLAPWTIHSISLCVFLTLLRCRIFYINILYLHFYITLLAYSVDMILAHKISLHQLNYEIIGHP